MKRLTEGEIELIFDKSPAFADDTKRWEIDLLLRTIDSILDNRLNAQEGTS